MPEVREAIALPIGPWRTGTCRCAIGSDAISAARGYDLASGAAGLAEIGPGPLLGRRTEAARIWRAATPPAADRRACETGTAAGRMLCRACRLAGRHSGTATDFAAEAPARTALAALGLARPGSPVLVIAPGAEYGPAKRWPARHFAAVAQASVAQGWEVWLLGSPADRETAAQIPCTQNLAGRTSLDQAAALLSLADAVFSNDSGLMHVAAALNRPQVALFGPSDPARTGPRNPAARVLRLGIDCSPCNQADLPSEASPLPRRSDAGDGPCGPVGRGGTNAMKLLAHQDLVAGRHPADPAGGERCDARAARSRDRLAGGGGLRRRAGLASARRVRHSRSPCAAGARLRSRWRWPMLIRRLRRQRYDLVIDAQGLIKSAFSASNRPWPVCRLRLDIGSRRHRFACPMAGACSRPGTSMPSSVSGGYSPPPWAMPLPRAPPITACPGPSAHRGRAC